MKKNGRYIIIQIPPDLAGAIIASINDISTENRSMLETLFTSFQIQPSTKYEEINESTIYDIEYSETLPSKIIGLKNSVKKEITSNIQNVFKQLENSLISESKKFDEMIALHSRYNRVEKEYKSGRITFDEYDRFSVQITTALSYMINDLNEFDINF